MFALGCVSSLALCSLWSGEWARRKGLDVKSWSLIGAITGPFGVVALALRDAEASLCPHCKTPMRFEERYCATCRAHENMDQQEVLLAEALDDEILLPHGFFEDYRTA